MGRLSTDKLVWLLGTVARLHASPKYRGEEFVPLYTKLLKHYLGGTYQKYVRRLLSEGLLEAEEDHLRADSASYVPGVVSKRYRVAKAYNSPLRPVPIMDPVLVAKVKASWGRTTVLEREPYLTMRRHFDRVGIDVKGVQDMVVSQIIRKRAKSVRAERMAYFSAVELGRGYIRFNVNAVNKRLDTNVTNMRKDIRAYIKIDEDVDLVSVDLKNSQPFILSAIIKGYSIIQDIIKGEGGESMAYVDKLIQSHKHILGSDAEEFVLHASRGTVYESIVIGAGNNLGLDIAREHGKKIFLAVLYSGRRGNPLFGTDDPTLRSLNPRQVFRSVYPSLYDFLRAVKESRGINRDLAIYMQRIEAHLVLDRVARRVVAEHGDSLPFLTVHDSFICKRRDVGHVVRIASETVLNQTGTLPCLDVEYREQEVRT